MKRLMIAFVTFLSLVGVGTVVIALAQDAIGWGWWWVVPLAGVIILVILAFRLLVQRALERQEAEDRRLDALEQQGAEPSQAEPDQVEPSQADPSQADPDRAESDGDAVTRRPKPEPPASH